MTVVIETYDFTTSLRGESVARSAWGCCRQRCRWSSPPRRQIRSYRFRQFSHEEIATESPATRGFSVEWDLPVQEDKVASEAEVGPGRVRSLLDQGSSGLARTSPRGPCQSPV